MGTHISRVKSVDLDSWTDEQLQSMLKWGNTRANKYSILDPSQHTFADSHVIDTGKQSSPLVMFPLKRTSLVYNSATNPAATD